MVKLIACLRCSSCNVSGGNAGVGLETAVDMAARGARVVLGCRNKGRAEAAITVIKGDFFMFNPFMPSFPQKRCWKTV